MSFLDDMIDVSTALGKGVYSVGEDIALGMDRTVEGLGFGQSGRSTVIAYENSAMSTLLQESIQYGMSGRSSPIFKAIVHILEHYYTYFPEAALSYLLKQAGTGAAYITGRMLIGRQLATTVATRIAAAIAITSAYKVIARRIGVSAGVSATWIGTPIGLLMMQGLLQRSSNASFRLKAQSPKLYRLLRQNGDLQLLYFLLEKPLGKYVSAIAIAEKDLAFFQATITEKYQLK